MTKITVKIHINDPVSKEKAALDAFSKIDDEKRQVFGFFSVVEENGKPLVDYQGDVISPDELEKAAYSYVINSRMGDERHDERPKAVLIESMFFSKEKQEALGIDLNMVAWWGGFLVQDEELWQKIKSGRYSMFSIGGRSDGVNP